MRGGGLLHTHLQRDHQGLLGKVAVGYLPGEPLIDYEEMGRKVKLMR
jgi:hypothetical protein